MDRHLAALFAAVPLAGCGTVVVENEDPVQGADAGAPCQNCWTVTHVHDGKESTTSSCEPLPPERCVVPGKTSPPKP